MLAFLKIVGRGCDSGRLPTRLAGVLSGWRGGREFLTGFQLEFLSFCSG